jgi:hypothetical protein
MICPFGEKLAIRFAMLQIKVLRTQEHLITHFVDFLYMTLICKRFLSLLSGNQTSACKAKGRLQMLNKSSRSWVLNFYNLTHWSLQVIARQSLT